MNNIIDVKNLTFNYSDKSVLENITFSISNGDFVGIIGPNGSGKSTLIKLILKILKPTSGEIKIFDQDIETFSNWNRISYVSQKANAFNMSFPATVEEVVGANLYSKIGLFKKINKEHKKQIQSALEIVGMGEYQNTLIGKLSGGQQQRIFIARAIVNEPSIIFLDEPTVGVDAKAEEVVYCLLAELNKKYGITIIMITHDISAVTVHANKIACLGNKDISIHNAKDLVSDKFISNLYGYDVNLHVHNHVCQNCSRRNDNNA